MLVLLGVGVAALGAAILLDVQPVFRQILAVAAMVAGLVVVVSALLR